MRSRRDFLKILSVAVGATLTGCGGGSSEGTTAAGGGTVPVNQAVPMAYQYFSVVRGGDPLPGGFRVASKGIANALGSNADSPPPFMGAVVITDSRHIYFHALDESETRGIYRIDVDARYNRSVPKKVIREGDRLPDGTRVSDFSDGDVNNGDDFFIGVVDPDGINSLQYAAGGGSFAPLAKSGSSLAGMKLAEDITCCQGIADDGGLIFVAEYLISAEDAEGDGLFYVPSGRPQDAKLLLANQELVPGTSCAIETMSTTEISAQGRYLVQGSIAASAGAASINAAGQPQTILLAGNVGEAPEVLAIDRALSAGADGVRGSVYMCPRLNTNRLVQAVGFIVQVNEDLTDLRLGNTIVARGDMNAIHGTITPKGGIIQSFLPPVFHRTHVYFQAFTDKGMEILRWTGIRNGAGQPQLETILARGDEVNGKTVETILFGCLPEAVNASGEFVAIIEFTDGETDIFLGAPV